eukprot:CAMPEP_0117588944 /NCGR_PEP_ID=MMETSP0784-20121206/70131_1 /TAXON_ID=39447 /ORGANISM="" /LENGTH=66 /DNA_ID=CAMNT_0005390357 /DNA_START=28 /DNA_END=226 /DNA_ORIENTATION=+
MALDAVQKPTSQLLVVQDRALARRQQRPDEDGEPECIAMVGRLVDGVDGPVRRLLNDENFRGFEYD